MPHWLVYAIIAAVVAGLVLLYALCKISAMADEQAEWARGAREAGADAQEDSL